MADETIPRGERTRDEILQTAYLLFLKNGYHGTSMRQVAREAGIALGGIYNHFTGKEEIFKEVFLAHNPWRQIISLVGSIQGEILEDALRDAARSIVSGLGDNTDALKLIFIELVEFNAQHVHELFPIIFPQLMEFAQRFLAGRDELRDIPPLVLVRSFIGLFFSYAVTEIIIADQLPPEGRANALDYFIDIYLHGILVNDPSEEVS